jgi:hypothetical protein
MVREIDRKQQTISLFKVGKFALQKRLDSGNLALCEACSQRLYRSWLLCLAPVRRIRKAS